MKNFLWVFLLVTYYYLVFPSCIFAKSTYVLPYPSTMPGSFYYKLHLALEEFMQYWYYGNFGQFKYNLKESDKYLVEAKTLFEYNQYLLGYKALKKSDSYFQKTKPFLAKAQKEGNSIVDKISLLQQAAAKHIEVLEKIK